MDKEQQTSILKAISNRATWENELRMWYNARHRGIRRQRKPYPGAPDLHFPLCDSLIKRSLPFYIQQLYLSENIASFRPLFDQDSEETEQLQAWYDYQLKQHSNAEEEFMTSIDQMLSTGRGIEGVSYDQDQKRIFFYDINPLYFIVPDKVDDIQRDAAWVLHVENVTVAQYKSNDKYNQDDSFVKSVTGAGDNAGQGMQMQYEQAKAYREGLTYASDNLIVVWNLYTKQKDGSILLETISPNRPIDDNNIREPFTLPYNQGVFKNGAYPFFSIRYEIKDKGWYSPRGIIEQALPFENSLTATWNAKHEWMDFACRPTYKATQPIANIGNIKLAPGDVKPFGIEMDDNPAAPMAFSEEMQAIRATAEYLIQIPDVGANTHLSGRPGYGGEKPTATQIQAIVGQSNQSNDLHGRLFKMDMAKGLDMAWAILLQYNSKNLTYFVGKTSSKLDPQVFTGGDYEIELNVSADSWNKEAQQQKAAGLLQLFGQSPFIDQGDATKKALDYYSPGLSRELYRDPGIKQQSEAERQEMETLMMLNKFSVSVKPFDDDKAHLQSMMQYGQVAMQEVQQGIEKPPDAMVAQAFTQHIQGHLQALQQKKDPTAQQANQMMAPFLQILGSIAAQAQQGMPGANGAAQPPPAPMANGATGGASGAPPDNSPQVANALANLMKAGAQVSTDDVNAALAKMGLPPLVQSIAPTAQHLNTAKTIADAIAPPNASTPKSSNPVS